jgi:hypothetical protein
MKPAQNLGEMPGWVKKFHKFPIGTAQRADLAFGRAAFYKAVADFTGRG